VDKATIDAMRAVLDMHEWSIKHYEDRGADRISTKFGDLPIETLRVANRGFRALVDQAAAKPAATVEPTLEDLIAVFDKRLAAMNRANFLRASDWRLTVGSDEAGTTMSIADASMVGDWLAESEQAEKGGA